MNNKQLTKQPEIIVSWLGKSTKWNYVIAAIWLTLGIGQFIDSGFKNGYFGYLSFALGVGYLLSARFANAFNTHTPNKVEVYDDCLRCYYGLKTIKKIQFEFYNRVFFDSYHLVFEGNDEQVELYLNGTDPIKSITIKTAVRKKIEAMGIEVVGG